MINRKLIIILRVTLFLKKYKSNIREIYSITLKNDILYIVHDLFIFNQELFNFFTLEKRSRVTSSKQMLYGNNLTNGVRVSSIHIFSPNSRIVSLAKS
jgi:hypothetical protein